MTSGCGAMRKSRVAVELPKYSGASEINSRAIAFHKFQVSLRMPRSADPSRIVSTCFQRLAQSAPIEHPFRRREAEMPAGGEGRDPLGILDRVAQSNEGPGTAPCQFPRQVISTPGVLKQRWRGGTQYCCRKGCSVNVVSRP